MLKNYYGKVLSLEGPLSKAEKALEMSVNYIRKNDQIINLLGKLVDPETDSDTDVVLPQGLQCHKLGGYKICLLYTSPSPRDGLLSRMPSSA